MASEKWEKIDQNGSWEETEVGSDFPAGRQGLDTIRVFPHVPEGFKLCPCDPAGRTQPRSLQKLQIRAWKRSRLPSARGAVLGGFLGELLLSGLQERCSTSRLPRERGDGRGLGLGLYSCSQTEQASEELLMDESIISLKRGLRLP